jgi:excisionase family DNA binding protein
MSKANRRQKEREFFRMQERLKDKLKKKSKSLGESEGLDKGGGGKAFFKHNLMQRGNVPGGRKGSLEGMSEYFTVSELAKEFRVNPKTIYRRLWARGIPAYKVGRTWRIAKKDIKWLRQ